MQGKAPAAKLGAELRAARTKQGWELPQLAESLRIRLAYLQAIEDGEVAELPGATYALGFVRAYASALGLDAETMAKRFRDEAATATATPALRFPAAVPRQGVPAGALMLLGLLILAGAYGFWYRATEHRHTLVETVPPIPDRLDPAAASKPAPSPQVASILPAAGTPAAAPPAPAPGIAPPNAAPSSAAPTGAAPTGAAPSGSAPIAPVPTSAAPAAPATAVAAASNPAVPASPSATPPNPAQSAAQAAAAPASPAANGAAPTALTQAQPASAAPANPGTGPNAPAPPTQPATPGRIVLRFTGDAWVTLKSKTGPALLNRMMHAGDHFELPADTSGLTLTTGVAAATEIDVDGTPIPGGLGSVSVVRRDIPMDPEVLKSGQMAHAPAKHAAQ